MTRWLILQVPKVKMLEKFRQAMYIAQYCQKLHVDRSLDYIITIYTFPSQPSLTASGLTHLSMYATRCSPNSKFIALVLEHLLLPIFSFLKCQETSNNTPCTIPLINNLAIVVYQANVTALILQWMPSFNPETKIEPELSDSEDSKYNNAESFQLYYSLH